MKSQIAIFEAFLSITLLLGATAIGGALLYTSPLISRDYNFNYPNIAYDFSNLLYVQSVRSCLAGANYTCIGSLLEKRRYAYRLLDLRINASEIDISAGSSKYCTRYINECLPDPLASGSIVCINGCGA